MLENKAIFWDRDGIINEIEVEDGKSLSPRKFKDFKVFPFVKEVLSMTNKLGYMNFIFTNQPDISRALMDQKELNFMHDLLIKNYPIQKIYCCPHSNEDNCLCRKPMPGMIKSCFEEFLLDIDECLVVGDRITDIISGNLAGIKKLYLLKKSYSLNCYSAKNLPKYNIISHIKEIPNILMESL